MSREMIFSSMTEVVRKKKKPEYSPTGVKPMAFWVGDLWELRTLRACLHEGWVRVSRYHPKWVR